MRPLLAALGARLVVRIAPEPAAQVHIDERYAPAALAALAISISGGVQFRRGVGGYASCLSLLFRCCMYARWHMRHLTSTAPCFLR